MWNEGDRSRPPVIDCYRSAAARAANVGRWRSRSTPPYLGVNASVGAGARSARATARPRENDMLSDGTHGGSGSGSGSGGSGGGDGGDGGGANGCVQIGWRNVSGQKLMAAVDSSKLAPAAMAAWMDS